VIRDLLLLATGALLATLEAALATVVRLGPLSPNLALPIVIYLGIAPDVSLARAALLSFALGLFADAASGHAMGLTTFLYVALLLAARGLGVRLLMRGRASQVLITAVSAIACALVVVALRRVFRRDDPVATVSLRHLFVSVLAPSLATGAVAPFVFQLVRRIDTLRRRDEAASLT